MKNFKDIIGCAPIHPFPARMAPSLVWDNLPPVHGEPLTVLDPMLGSGTVSVVARCRGHAAIGVDADPLAVLMSRTWCANAAPETIISEGAKTLKIARGVFRDLPSGYGYPDGASDETKAFVRYWFDPINSRQLLALTRAIRSSHAGVADHLWCAFSRLIIAKERGASLAMDLSHSRPHKVFLKGPIKPFDEFDKAVATVAANAPFRAGDRRPLARIGLGDARSLSLGNNTVDLVITSPPYSNAIDYMRCSKFSLIWMQHCLEEIRNIRAASIGTEACSRISTCDQEFAGIVTAMGKLHKLPAKHQRMLLQYVIDLDAVMDEIARVLKPGGKAVFVVGDSSIRGVFIENSCALRALGDLHGMKFASSAKRELPANRRYLPPPTSATAGSVLACRMREEVVLKLRKSA